MAKDKQALNKQAETAAPAEQTNVNITENAGATETTTAPDEIETPPTFEEKLKAAKEKAFKAATDAMALLQSGADWEVITKANDAAFRASKEVDKIIADNKAEEAKQKAENARKERISVLADFLILHNLSLSDEILSETETANMASMRTDIENALASTAKVDKPVIHLKEGTTGAQLERGSKAKEIIELYKDYLAQGKDRTEAAKLIQSEHGHARGTTHSVILAYRQEIGEVAK